MHIYEKPTPLASDSEAGIRTTKKCICSVEETSQGRERERAGLQVNVFASAMAMIYKYVLLKVGNEHTAFQDSHHW